MATVSFSPTPEVDGIYVNVEGSVMLTCVMFATDPA